MCVCVCVCVCKKVKEKVFPSKDQMQNLKAYSKQKVKSQKLRIKSHQTNEKSLMKVKNQCQYF